MKTHAFLPIATYPETIGEAALGNAVDIAAALGASLRVIAIRVDIPDVSNALSKFLLDTPQLIRDAETKSRIEGDRLARLVKDKAIAVGVEVSVGSVTAPVAALADVAAVHARYLDLSLVPVEFGNETSRMMAEVVVFGSGRPVLLVPDRVKPSAFGHVAIAWDGSRAAARAVADARAFLQRATKISVFTVYDEKPIKEKDAGERLAVALRESGLPAEAVVLDLEDCPIAETLQLGALEHDANLLVMGGYGHSRLRDFVLGGATAGVLSDLRLPVLLSH
jgi:nucleotide-binding universal stress UspA family protein